MYARMTKMKGERPLYATETALCYKDLKGKRQVSGRRSISGRCFGDGIRTRGEGGEQW